MPRPPRSRATREYTFQRAYKACIPCRRRKVKCAPGPDPHQPCKRCRKMKLECWFSTKQPWSRTKPEGQSSNSRQKGSNARQTAAPPFDVRSEENAIRIWEGCRFVKMGWFIAEEALLYTDWFFRTLAPATTPILTDFFASHNSHYWLITQEPVLCCTILMISARYHTLPGPSGTSRGFYIHNRLWQYCQYLILRILLGQEKLSKAKTRHISTIEALLLLSEWYPLALHFPHETEGWDSGWILTESTLGDPPLATQERFMQDSWREDVVEPTRRADRMSWMLVSSALVLAHELGVFDSRGYVNNIAKWQGRFMASLVDLTGLPALYMTSSLLGTRLAAWKDFRRAVESKSPDDLIRQTEDKSADSRYNTVLNVEYHYVRVFANSLGVQRIKGTIDSTFVSQAHKLSMSRSEYEFIEEVIDGACVILEHITSLPDIKCLPAYGRRNSRNHCTCSTWQSPLSSPTPYDIHLVSQYAALPRTHLSRLRQTFTSSSSSSSSNSNTGLEDQPNQTTQNEPPSLEEQRRQQQEQLNPDTTWDPNIPSLPLDPLMAPFGAWDGEGPTDLGLDADCLDLDFIWNLPP
ncbi:Zn(II)2Cys6 transcription factor domain-containing protein [Aspergillus lucknowensis]|uniref:Zn(2)-C6 fungal-type domain-containing protein n=1 Tax=Aspergillus lucknowensis TaxID=176173 RepID=A0ABR4LKS7_9EURO